MKIRILDRILVAPAGLLMLAGCAAVTTQLFFGKDVIGWVTKVLTSEQNRIWLIIVLLLLVILACYCILILFRHHGRRDKFVMQKTENGELSISLKAMESMVQKCLDPHKELTVQGVRLENQKGGLLIRIRGTVAGGVSIPLTVDALQQQIKQYVTACSGVEVKDIRVLVESSGPDATESLFAIEPPTARALPGGPNANEEKPTENKENEPAQMTQEEVEQVMAEMPAPLPSDAEDTAPVVEVSAAAAAAAEILKSEAPQEEDDRPIHQRLFSNPEEPCVMPMPPMAEEAGSKAPEAEKNEAEKPEEPVTEKTKPEDEKPADVEEKEAPQDETEEGGKEQ